MAQVCTICGKGPQFGNKISHAHNVSKRAGTSIFVRLKLK